MFSNHWRNSFKTKGGVKMELKNVKVLAPRKKEKAAVVRLSVPLADNEEALEQLEGKVKERVTVTIA